MRHFALLVFTLLLVTSWSRASFPPPQKTLAERLDLSTHVIVGTAKKVRVVESFTYEDGKIGLREVVPEPDQLDGLGQQAEVEIEVNEVLYPSTWKAPKAVKYLFGGGHFEVETIRKDTVGNKAIYLMSNQYTADLKDADNEFATTYGWHLLEPLEAKPEVVALLQKRSKKEVAANTPK